MMRNWLKCLFVICLPLLVNAKTPVIEPLNFYKADNPYINYVGRVDFSHPDKPRFWSPGVYVQVRFSGTSAEIDINDQEQYGKNHNYLEVVVDNRTPVRLQTTGKSNHIQVAQNLPPGIHTLTVCKNTETSIGYLEFAGIKCARLLPWLNSTKRKIEFIGNSITCGTGSDQSQVACSKGEWFDQHNAYMSYGPATARALKAQWQLTSYSGIGLIHSCCDIQFAMPQIYDRVNLLQDTLKWDFKKYVPDVVTICLGQNDGIQDSTIFCSAYVGFIQKIRTCYPQASIVILSSPMGDMALTAALKKYVHGIEAELHHQGELNVSHYFFKLRYTSGCNTHPNLAEHQLIAAELTGYLRKLKGWGLK